MTDHQNGAHHVICRTWYKIETKGPLFKKQEKSVLKGNKIESFFLSFMAFL